MNIKGLQDVARQFVADNATVLLTAGGVVGTVTTGVLAWRGGYKTAEAVVAEEKRREEDNTYNLEDEKLDRKEKLLLAAPQAITPVVTGGLGIAAIIFSHRMSAQKAAAMAALYGLTRDQFEEYRDKVAEKLTGPKNQQIKDEIAQDTVNRAPGSKEIVIINGDDVLCFDKPTGRYFKSSMEKINRAVNATNQEIINHGCTRASFYYDELELAPTTWSDDVGFNLNNMVDLDISTTQVEDGRPCLVLNFMKFPIEDYERTLYE